jgi:hypothetical protein
MPHHHALIDTCVWLDLAIDPAANEVVVLLEKLVQDEAFTLVVPSIIEEEFDRNKVRCAEDLALRLSKRVQETLKYAREFGESENNTILVPALETFRDLIKQVPAGAEKLVSRLNHVLRHPDNKRIPTSSKILERAARRGCEKRAPFISNKNNVADAVILESFLEFFSEHETDSCTFSFVTANKSDFCDLKDNRKPHPDLDKSFSSGAVRFSINIAEEINAIVNSCLPVDARSGMLLSDEVVRHVASTPGWSGFSKCPRCGSNKMASIGGHPSAHGAWTMWQMCNNCGYRVDTGEFLD